MLKEWLKQFKELDRRGKAIRIMIALMLMILLYICSCLLVGSLISAFKNAIKSEGHGLFYYGLVSTQGRSIGLVISVCVLVFLLYFGLRESRRNGVESTDGRGVGYMQKKTFGSARWMSEEEIAERFNVTDIAETASTVLGQLSSSGEKVVSVKENIHGSSGDQNYLVIGSPGTGKSYCYVRTELIQTIKRGDSFVVTDPSGELYSSLSHWCKSMGADVRVLNLYEPDYSDFWNPLDETISEETERLDSSRLNEFVDIYMANATADDRGSFWYDCALNLFKAMIACKAYERETYIIAELRNLYESLAGDDHVTLAKIRHMNSMEPVSISEIKDDIRKLAKWCGVSRKDINKAIDDIERMAPEYTIGSVRDMFRKFEKTEAVLNDLPDWHPGKEAYLIFATNSAETVRNAALQNTMMKMQVFTDERLRAMLSHSSIRLKDINRKQCAWFAITNDKSNVTRPLASLFFSFLIKDLQDNFDSEQHVALSKGKDNPCLPVTLMLDEFFSIGIIGGDPDRFAVTMSNIRKRKAHLSPIVQSITQISQLYGKDNANTIITCCSTIIFLGCNDLETARFISRKTGESTVLSESHQEEGNIDHLGGSYSMSAGRRTLLTEDEVSRWENRVLVLKRGCFPMDLLPFGWTDHPECKSRFMKPVSIYETYKPITSRLRNIEEKFQADKSVRINTVSKDQKSYKKTESIDVSDDVKEKKVLDSQKMERKSGRRRFVIED